MGTISRAVCLRKSTLVTFGNGINVRDKVSIFTVYKHKYLENSISYNSAP